MDKLANDLYYDGDRYCFYEFDGKTNWFFNEKLTNKISRKKFKNFEVKCCECGTLSPIKSVTDKIQNKPFLCKKCRNTGEKNGMYGRHHTDETKKKLSEANKGENNYWYGKHLTDETKKKISIANKGKYSGEKNPMYGINVFELIENKYGVERVNEIKKKLSESLSGDKNPFYGKHHTEETKKNIK